VTAEPIGRYTDGEWHRLHPLTPLLKGGIAFVAGIGIVVVNMRDYFIESFFGNPGVEGDPIRWAADEGYLGIAVLIFIGILLLFVAGFYASWRMHSFRITDEVVEVRSGILFRTNRKGRLDRIQGININRPFLARLVGTAKLEVNVAGQDANVQLDYLGSRAADDLRADILRLASGTQEQATEITVDAAGTVIERRVAELLAPELDPVAVRAESVVTLSLKRLIGSLLLGGLPFMIIIVGAGLTWAIIETGSILPLAGLIPALIGGGTYYVQRFTRSLRYSIAATPDGVRVGFGLLSTTNETLPPGRIHSVQVSQPLLWRIPGWWEIKVNRASTSSTKSSSGIANTTILPVGDRDDVRNVLALLIPDLAGFEELVFSGLESKGGDDGFTNSPKRAAVLRWFSWRRNGFALTPSATLLRKGAIWRELVIVPDARMQSVAVRQGPILRRLKLAGIRIHTVAGPITPSLGALDVAAVLSFFAETADAAVRNGSTDTSHRWRSGELAASGVAASDVAASDVSATAVEAPA